MVCIVRTLLLIDVRLSITHWYSIKIAIKISPNFLHRRVHTLLCFFRTKRYNNISSGTPLSGASNAGGYEKIAIFSQ